jgi:hypothetical protein
VRFFVWEDLDMRRFYLEGIQSIKLKDLFKGYYENFDFLNSKFMIFEDLVVAYH